MSPVASERNFLSVSPRAAWSTPKGSMQRAWRRLNSLSIGFSFLLAASLLPLGVHAQQVSTNLTTANKAGPDLGRPKPGQGTGNTVPGTNSAPHSELDAKELTAEAEKGGADAQFHLGLLYEDGVGVEQDLKKAATWYRRAAESGNEYAQFKLGGFYHFGTGVERDYINAAKWYLKSAEQGYDLAQLKLGLMYEEGEGVEKDPTEAAKWFRKAAEQGNPFGAGKLGLMYESGQGVKRSLEAAAKWFLKAAERDEPFAQAFLANMYRTGRGVEKDLTEAAKWFRKAAEKDSAWAAWQLGAMYEKGEGVDKDLKEAEALYRKAAEQGSSMGKFFLGALYYGRALRMDDATKKTSNQRSRETIQDYTQAARWFREAAESGEPGAQDSLGDMHLEGRGMPSDYKEALRWFRRSANQGHAAGQLSLGGCYEKGQGVAQDFVEAYKWYNLAASEAGEGSWQRDALAEKMTSQQIAEAQRRSAAFVARKESSSSKEFPLTRETPAGESRIKASGSGFFVTDDGYVVTSFHVVEDADRISLKTKQGVFSAKLITVDKVNDVAMLKVVGKFSALPVAPSRGVKLGESVFTIGFPNVDLQGFAPKLTKGEISSLTGAQDDPREFQISVAVQPGNSGGPLVNQYGSVVGIVEARLADIATLKSTGALPQNVNYAVKSSVLSVLLESLPEITAKLKEPGVAKDRRFEDVVKEAESATAIVLVY